MGRQRASNDPSVRTELTERQREVLALIARGRTNGQIADELGLSLDGVKWHVREILTRLGVDSREEAAEWWRRNRGLRERMPGWLGWPLAAGVGGVGASAVAVVVAVAITVGGGDASPRVDDAAGVEDDETEEPEFLEQPDLTLVGEGDGWRVYWDEEGGVPHAEDAVLALLERGEATHVLLVEGATGRVAARWEVGYNGTAVLRERSNELLVSDGDPRDGEHPWRLLRLSLAEPELVGEQALPGRLHARWVTGGILHLSNDESTLFYIAPLYPDCFEQIGEHARVARDCDRYRAGLLNLDAPTVAPTLVDIGESCHLGGAFGDSEPGNDGIFFGCAHGEVYLVRADGRVEQRSERFPERRDAAGELGNVLNPSVRLLGEDWVGGVHRDGIFVRVWADGTVERQSGLLGSFVPRQVFARSPSQVAITYVPSTLPEEAGYVIFDAERGEVIAQHTIGEFLSMLSLDGEHAMTLGPDGALRRLDLDSGSQELLPYRLDMDTLSGPLHIVLSR